MAKKLYVGNLNYRTTESRLRMLFEEHGQVESVTVVTDRDTGRSKGFGFVEMGSEEEAQAAKGALNGQTVDEREIRVDEARPRTEQDRRPRGGRGGRSRW